MTQYIGISYLRGVVGGVSLSVRTNELIDRSKEMIQSGLGLAGTLTKSAATKTAVIGTKTVLLAGLGAIAFSWVSHLAYSSCQRAYHNHLDRLEEGRQTVLDGDGTLVQNILAMPTAALVRWSQRSRGRWAKATRLGDDLFHYQLSIRAIYGRVARGDDFIEGCISSMGDIRGLSRGELYIQLNRHLNAFIKTQADPRGAANPLAYDEILALRAATDVVCGDHITVQISR